MSGSWNGGYVTDTGYLPGWYGQQSPMHMAMTCLLMGVACDLPDADAPLHYLELGCGLGFGALVLAAGNPSWGVTGIDFNPAHIALARSVARDAGLTNVTFLEADLATLHGQEGGRQLPQADFVSLHGLWSWVSAEVRSGIVRLLAAKVAAGGVVHVSYTALPAWQGGIGMQKLMRLSSEDPRATSHRRVQRGVSLVQALAAAGAPHLNSPGLGQQIVQRLPELPAAYLAHEYLNDAWSPCFHADVAEAMAGAKLDYAGSASLTENFAALMLTDEQRALHDAQDDPRLRELIKDLCLPRGLRHDVFVRGSQVLRPAVRTEALKNIVLALTTPPDSVAYEFEVASGVASISPGHYGPMIAAMARQPCSVGDLMSLSPAGHANDDPREVIGILAGAGYAVPVARPGAPPHPSAVRFNRVAAEWLAEPAMLTRPAAVASFALGGGFPATVIDLFVLDRLRAGETAAQAPDWVAALAPGADPEAKASLRDGLIRCMEQRIPLMRAAGAG